MLFGRAPVPADERAAVLRLLAIESAEYGSGIAFEAPRCSLQRRVPSVARYLERGAWDLAER
jgi:hypothetical protein